MPDINLQEAPGLHHSMDARYYRQRQTQPTHTENIVEQMNKLQTPAQYPSEQSQISQQQLERLHAMPQSERNDFVQRMNSVVPQAIPNWENSFPQR